MNSNKWLYFRTVTSKIADDGVKDSSLIQNTSVCIPADSIIDMSPLNGTTLLIEFESVKNISGDRTKESTAVAATTTTPGNDYVELTLQTANTHKDVINAISDAINGTQGASMVVIADDLTANPTYVRGVSACGTINTPKTSQGYGKHEMSCYVKPVGGTTDSTNDVVASLPFYLPKEVVILEAAMYPLKLASNDIGSVALEYHTAAIANDTASAGTEIVGANTLNLAAVVANNTDSAGGANDFGDSANKTGDNTSIPDADLDISNNATVGKGIHSGVMDPIATGNAVSYFHVCAKEDMATMSGNPRVQVYVKWWGGPAVAIA
tara:strand:- start:458 stop:1426 length:969 start_codon:yes stop_codon:yes gene_type:complete